MKGSKILATIVAIAMVMSTMIVLNEVTDFKLVENVSAVSDGEVTNPGSTLGLELTCGEVITYKINDNSLTYNEDYALGVWNGSAWIKLEEASADYYGDITIDFHVPWWDLLGTNPIGDWNIRLFNTTTESSMGPSTQVSDNETLTIGNIFDVTFYEGSDEIEYLSFNKSYGITNQFGVTVRNYTGADYDDGEWEVSADFDDAGVTFDYALYLPDGTEISDWGDTGKGGSHSYPVSNGASGTGYYDGDNYETFYWVNVTQHGSTTVYSNVSLPCMLNVSWYGDGPGDLVWGTDDSVDFTVGVYDGNGNLITSDNDYVSGYEMAMYYPTNGDYTLVTNSNKDTYTGYYIYNDLDTDDYNAGTWYIGTMETNGASYRMSQAEPDKAAELPANFIPYLEFDVATYDSVDVDFRNSDEVISGFDQTINISVDNETHNQAVYDSLTAENFHITGLKAWNESTTTAFDDEDIVTVSEFGGGSVTMTRRTDKRAYYEFNYHFNETGTATVIVQYPGNGTHLEGQDSYYSDTYGNENLLPNWMGQTTFDVDSPGNLNMIVRGTMPSAVNVNADGNCYLNESQSFYIDFYGSDSSERVNATLEVSGCGLDFTIEQDDTAAGNDYLMSKGNGWYQVKLEPKIGGTLTLTATNGSDTDTADYSIDGLTGSVTTSVGDNLYISVTESEKITVEVKSGGGYPIETANVYVSLYDNEWSKGNSLISASQALVNDSSTDDLDGSDGIYEFNPSDDAIHDVGYLVCAAESGGYWMYDVVELEPVHDIGVTIIDPEGAANQTLTVGIDDQTLELQIKDPDGNILEGSSGGSPTVTGYLIDDDHTKDDPLQTLTFEQKSAQDKWVLDTTGDNFPYWKGTLLIEAVNNTGLNEHDGNVSIPVEYATVTFSPSAAVAGISTKNLTVEITVLDALGNPIEDGTDVYLNLDDATDTVIDSSDNPVELDEDGKGEFEIDEVGDLKGSINCTFVDTYANNEGGNRTSGIFTIDFPDFTLVPAVISTELDSATVLVTAKDFEGDPVVGINITLWALVNCIETPDPIQTDENGQAEFDVEPLSSGKANVTIVQDLEWTTGGAYTSGDWVRTSDYLTVTRQTLDVTVSPTTVYEDESFTVTVKDDDVLVDDADVTFDGTTKQTEDGVVSFKAGDPGIESQQYTITVEKDGYPSTSATVTVINVYKIKISGPASNPKTGEKFTVTVLAKGAALAGANVTFEGETVTTDDNGKATLTAPNKKGTYTVTATYEDSKIYKTGTLSITVESGTPGFELITLIVAIGVAFILLRRRRNK